MNILEQILAVKRKEMERMHPYAGVVESPRQGLRVYGPDTDPAEGSGGIPSR